MQALQKRLGHRLGAVGDHLEARKVVALEGIAQHQQVQERRRCWKKIDLVLLDRLTNRVGRSLLDDHHGAAIGERIEQGVNAADVVEQQEADGAERAARHLVLFQERHQVMQRGLGLACGTAGE